MHRAITGAVIAAPKPAAEALRTMPLGRLCQLGIALALVLVLASQPLGKTATAETAETLIVNLTSDDVWTAQMALGFAKAIREDGHDVVLYLNVRAVGFANESIPQHRTALTGKTPHELIAELIEAGVQVFVCPGCTRQAGLDIDQRLDGVMPGGEAYRSIVMAPSTRIVSY